MNAPSKSFLTRVATALVVLPVVLALVWIPELRWGLTIFVMVVASVGMHEFFAMARKTGYVAKRKAGIAAGAAIVFSAGFGDPVYVDLALVAGIVFVVFLHIVRPPHSIGDVVSTVFGLVYTGWFPAHLILLHGIENVGAGLVTLLLLMVALTDTAAYFVGKTIGRNPLAPIISPKKTIEGGLGGLTFAVLGMGVAYALKQNLDWTALPDWHVARYLATGAVVSVVAQLGDLTASCMKRDAGIKDSGVLFPGHGGALDRCDGFLFAGPVLYYMSVF